MLKSGSRLTFDRNNMAELLGGYDVRNLADRAWGYYAEYKERLLNPEEVYLRENFIKK